MNFKRLLEYLNLEQSEFLFQFESHPHFPTALAFGDTLNFFSLKNNAYELEKEYWRELPDEFITIYNNNFTLIKKENQNFKIFSDDVKTISKEELYNNTTDFVLLYEKELQTLSKNTTVNKNTVFAIMFLVLLYSLFQQKWNEGVFNFLSIVGVYISLGLFNKKFGHTSIIINNICGGGKPDLQTNCSKIIDSDKINFYGLKISDFSLVYFVGILLIGVFMPETAFILKITTVISVLVIFYSIYIQVFIEKALCKICLIIITILLLQIVVAQFYFFSILNVNTIVLSILAFIVSFVGVASINDILNQREEFKKSNLQNLKFKRNFDLFKRELLSNEKINFQNTKTGFFLGRRDSKLHISLISNPYCGFCKDAHAILEELLKKYPDDISGQIRFNFTEKEDKKYNELMSGFVDSYNNNSQGEFLEFVDFWFKNKEVTKSTKNRDIQNSTIDFHQTIAIGNENKTAGLNFTPIFLINGYRFPEKYNREDIFYFIDELLEDESFC